MSTQYEKDRDMVSIRVVPFSGKQRDWIAWDRPHWDGILSLLYIYKPQTFICSGADKFENKIRVKVRIIEDLGAAGNLSTPWLSILGLSSRLAVSSTSTTASGRAE